MFVLSQPEQIRLSVLQITYASCCKFCYASIIFAPILCPSSYNSRMRLCERALWHFGFSNKKTCSRPSSWGCCRLIKYIRLLWPLGITTATFHLLSWSTVLIRGYRLSNLVSLRQPVIICTVLFTIPSIFLAWQDCDHTGQLIHNAKVIDFKKLL